MHSKVKVVIEQVGSPKSTEIKDVRSYLKEFLGKPRVIDVARQPWWVILNLFILPFSPKVSAALYRRLKGNSNCFPLLENTQSFAEVVKKNLDENIELDHCYAFSYPRFKDIFSKWESEDQDNRADKFLMIPQFPQYSESTSAGASDGMLKSFSGTTNVPAFEFYSNYHKLKAFIDLSVKKITETVSGQKLDALILSFHGMPLRRIIQKEDRYYLQCYETYKLIADQLVEKNIFTVEQIHFCFQSRFGSEQWIGPATDEYAVELVEKGSKHLACYCPSFVVVFLLDIVLSI